MITEFSIQNYRSIKNLQTLSFIASSIKSRKGELDVSNIIDLNDDIKLLKSLAVYGANGSGKSNIIRGLQDMLVFVKNSMNNENAARLLFFEKFILNTDSITEPLFFQIQFLLNNKRYRYGFEINDSIVTSEWLFGPAIKKEVYYFKRELNKVKINDKYFKEALNIPKKTLAETNLFLNLSLAYNVKISKEVKDYLLNNIEIESGISDDTFRRKTSLMLNDEKSKKEILDLLNFADFGINDIYEELLPSRSSNLDPMGKEIKILKSARNIYNNEGEIVGNRILWMNNDESQGTNKMFNYSGVLIDALLNGKTVFLDEFDARLHPVLTKKIVEMFNSESINKRKAQLVFVTHDVNLLDNKLLRRDQIYFTEKNIKGETSLYSLVDINGVRNDSSYGKDYIKGKYGAIPFLGDISNLFD